MLLCVVRGKEEGTEDEMLPTVDLPDGNMWRRLKLQNTRPSTTALNPVPDRCIQYDEERFNWFIYVRVGIWWGHYAGQLVHIGTMSVAASIPSRKIYRAYVKLLIEDISLQPRVLLGIWNSSKLVGGYDSTFCALSSGTAARGEGSWEVVALFSYWSIPSSMRT